MSESGEDKTRDDEIQEIFSDFSKRKQQEHQQEEEDRTRNRISLQIRGVITLGGVFLSVILLFNLMGKISGEKNPLRAPRPWAIGKRMDSDYKIDGCIFRLWRIRKAVDLYYADYKKFPENMQQLYENGYLKKKIVCPASQQEYIFEKKGMKTVFSCPVPHAHQGDIISIYCNVVSSPPIIERLNDDKRSSREK